MVVMKTKLIFVAYKNLGRFLQASYKKPSQFLASSNMDQVGL